MRKSQGRLRALSSNISRGISQDGVRDSGGGVRHRALLVGVNYSRTRGARALTGCVNDTQLMYRLLTEKFGFGDDGIWVMTDEPVEVGPSVRRFQPTRNNIMNGMRWLVHSASPGDSLFFFFGGHGSQVRDVSGDELDGWDETILPADYPVSGPIVDDDIHKIMVRGLCQGAHLTAVVDACSSGTIMDLPFVHGPLGGELGLAMGVSEAKLRANAAKASTQREGSGFTARLLKPLLHKRNKRRREDAEIVKMADDRQSKLALELKDNGRVVSFSGCADNQRSADAFSRTALTSYGAMTHAFVSAIHSADLGTPDCTFQSLLDSMQDSLKRGGHIQVPQLCCSHDGILQTRFDL
jgi:metacaspase-1